MGMFDHIKLTIKCPKCGNLVSNFQTKNNDCTMASLEFWQVDHFYSNCDNCDIWIEFNLKREAREKFTIGDYDIKLNLKLNNTMKII